MKHELALSKQVPLTVADFDVSGIWKNQLGSKMTLTLQGKSIKGTYDSPVSSAGNPIVGQLVGWVNGDLVSFTVNWPSAAITSWVGQIINDQGHDVIVTLWHLVTNIPDAQEPTGMWKSTFTGADRFHR